MLRYLPGMVLGAALILNACSGRETPRPVGAPAATAHTSTATQSPLAPTPTQSSTIRPTAAPAITLVTVTAAGGNVFIRRGPDLAYDSVGVLADGQRVTALARDVLGNWLQIEVPGTSEPGWISIQSRYTIVDGETGALPQHVPSDWPLQAWLRNCTLHRMEADPGGIAIPPVDEYPANDVALNPGLYVIRDLDVNGAPTVMEADIREGSEIDIREDGDGNRRKCAAP